MHALTRTALLASLLATSSCTQTSLYRDDGELFEADRITLRGRVCAEDTREAELPTRIVLMVDQASGRLFDDFDPAATRVPLLRGFIQSLLADSDVSFAVVGYGGVSKIHAPREGNFTRDVGELLNAVDLLAIAEPCAEGGLCRDPVAALRTARTLIEGDLSASEPGRRVLTQYAVFWVTAGDPAPLSGASLCCAPRDTACRSRGDTPSEECQAQRELEGATSLVDAALRAGALGVKLHAFHLAADEPDANAALEARLSDVTFAVGGTYQRFNSAATFNGRAFDVLSERPTLRAKTLVVANPHAVPTGRGVELDSDADGLTDAEEAIYGTDPTLRDTDGDRITDLVEVLLDLDPLVPDDPVACRGVEDLDRDLDGLSDCDEALLGTEPTLVDTDGDGIPDWLEVVGRINYLHPDYEHDADGDGVSNGDEVRQRTDPRSSDAQRHLADGYRYEVVDEGFVRELHALSPRRLDAVRIVEVGPATTPGRAYITYRAGTLAWQDPGETEAGAPVVVDLAATEPVELLLYARGTTPPTPDPVTGELPDPIPGSWARVEVQPWNLPPGEIVEPVSVRFRERHCLSYAVRNVRLFATLGDADGRDVGVNRLLLFFAESPSGARAASPGPVRIAEIPVLFVPPATRIPDGPVLEVFNDEFVRR